MKTTHLCLGLALVISSNFSSPVFAAEVAIPAKVNVDQHHLSANVPLDSYVYDYLEKLDGLGYLKEMRSGTKPYTRIQVAKYVQQIDESLQTTKKVEPFAKNMLGRLKSDFSKELSLLNGKKFANEFNLKEWTINSTSYHGNTLPQAGTKSSYQPLNINNNGYRFASGLNLYTTMEFDGNFGDHLVLSATPRISYDKDDTTASLESGYLKTNINNVEIQVGKDAMWWGEGLRGTRSFTNNAPALTSLKITNIDTMKPSGLFKFLGPSNMTFLYSVLESNRADTPYPSFVGFRKEFFPSANFTFSANKMDIVGGQGRMLSHSDYGAFLLGNNAGSSSQDKWDSQVGGDFRWRLPTLQGMQVYGEVYGEDQAHILRYIPFPSELSELFGVYIPRLSPSGDWDAHVEWAHTRPSWYVHGAYFDGWTYKNNILGDAMGTDASRYYLKITHYCADDLQLSINMERLIQDFEDPNPQRVDSLWFSARKEVGSDIIIDGSIGMANISNTDYQSGKTSHSYIVALSITKKY